MDLLLQAAKTFESLLDCEYRIVLGRKGNTRDFTIAFSKEGFYHLAGFQYIDDIDNLKKRTKKDVIFDDILKGKYTHEKIMKSSFSKEYENRINHLVVLDKILEVNEFICSFNAKQLNFPCIIKADFVMKNITDNGDTFIFCIERSTDEYQHLVTGFTPEDRKKNCTYRQTIWTLLFKLRINKLNSESVLIYKHPKYEPTSIESEGVC